MKTSKKVLAITLTAFVATTTTTPALVLAKDSSSSKEEVVYIISHADGSVDNVNVVNIFKGGDIIDYGNYASVKMLTSSDKIIQIGDEISFHTFDEKVYYQGTMAETEIPWNISIKYYLDGKEYSAQEIVDKSGNLEIKISITKNDEVEGSYFDDYALQTTLMLDTELCKNIEANGATMANVGANKQLAYTSLPGKGLEATIQANVKDFEMGAISINGVKLNLNVDVDDEAITQKVDQLMNATQILESGSKTLYDGTSALKTGGSNLNQGTSSLHSGISDLDAGIVTLQKGITSMQIGLDSLNSQSESLTNASSQVLDALKLIQQNLNSVSISAEEIQTLVTASNNIKTGINALSDSTVRLNASLGYPQYKAMMSQKGLNIDQLKSENENGRSMIQGQISNIRNQISILENTPNSEAEIANLRIQIQNLEGIDKLLSANTMAMNGTEGYMNEVSVGMNSLHEGVLNLKGNYEVFDTNVINLSNTLSGLVLKMSELTTGINELLSNYEGLDTGLHAYTQGVSTIVSSYKQIVSGVSSLASGSKELASGSNTLSAGSASLYDGIVSLCDGAYNLADGTSQFNSETANMSTELQTQIDDILSTIQGEQTDTVSFVSEKNEHVESLQFVIQVKGVEKVAQAVESEEVVEESKTIWEKFLSLFGIE